MVDFENTTPPGKDVDLVIGFTSQFELQRGQFHLGGTHGMLARHILLREFSKSMTEMEKLEVLVHELGHYLGAAHAAEPTSVMRPVLGDRQARSKRFRIFYDPLNALAINIVAAEFRGGVRSRGELSQAGRERLLPIYATIANGDAEDPTTGNMLRCIGAQKVDPRTQFRAP
ncbi:MAG: matrixin family metalloprotease [Pirellulales bacterium]